MAINDVYEIVVAGSIAGQRVVNVLHAKEKVASTAPIKAKSLALGWDQVFRDAWLACVAADYTMECIYARKVQPGHGIPYLHVLVAPNIGTVPGDSVPPNSPAVLSFHTDLAERSGRGRLFLSGISEGSQDHGLLSNAQMVLLTTFCDLFVQNTIPGDGLDPGEWESTVYSRALGLPNVIVTASPSASLANMQSRRQPWGMVP